MKLLETKMKKSENVWVIHAVVILIVFSGLYFFINNYITNINEPTTFLENKICFFEFQSKLDLSLFCSIQTISYENCTYEYVCDYFGLEKEKFLKR